MKGEEINFGIMILEEVIGDLFSAPPNVSLAHCVSADFAMKKGIAKTFRNKFGRINQLGEASLRHGNFSSVKCFGVDRH